MKTKLTIILVILLLIGLPNLFAQLKYPATKTVSQVDDYFGTKVSDPYRWLENDTADDTKQWIRNENKVTDGYLLKIPFRDSIVKEYKSLLNHGRISAPDKEGDYYYFDRNTGLQNQSVTYRTKNPADTSKAELFLDPNSFAKNGAVTVQETSFSNDGSLFAYLISNGGSDWRDVLIKNTHTGKLIDDTIKNVKFSGVAWKGNEGFYYSTYDVPAGENRLLYKTIHHTLYYHKLNTPQSQDEFVFGSDKQPHRYIDGYVTEDNHYLIITAAESTTGNELYIQDLTRQNAPVMPVVTGYESEQYVADDDDSTLYIYTNIPSTKLPARKSKRFKSFSR